ncbi:MAG: hypothetical protein HS115_13510 [Spirochaetales bacterium]|nr:hypothetical protein [Spirochaetales bacterium]
MRSRFEIHASGVDSQQLEKELERSLRRRKHSRQEIEFIKNLTFQPLPAENPGAFDAALTTELYDRPSSLPVFSRIRLPGILRPIARRLYSLIRSLYVRLGEYKQQAFYNVVHELLAIDYRLKNQARQLEAIAGLFLGEPTGKKAPFPLPVDQPEIAQLNQDLVALLPPGKKALIVNDDRASLGRLLRRTGYAEVQSHTTSPLMQSIAQTNGQDLLCLPEDVVLTGQSDDSLDLLVILHFENYAGDLDLLFALAARKLKAGGHLVFRYSLDGLDGGARRRPSIISTPVTLCRRLTGFSQESVKSLQAFRRGSFEMVLGRQ